MLNNFYWISLIAGAYWLFLVVISNTPSLIGKIVFKFVPFVGSITLIVFGILGLLGLITP